MSQQIAKYKCVCSHDGFKRGETITDEQFKTVKKEHFVKIIDIDLIKMKAVRDKHINLQNTIQK